MARGQRIAVLGAGMQGACVALELASRGCVVDLYDRAEEPLTATAVATEGKIHLGLVYAKDRSLETARRLLGGAMRFASSLRRWTRFSPELAGVTGPCLYAVPADSMLPPSDVWAHFQAVAELYRQAAAEPGCGYLDGDGAEELLIRELTRCEREELFDGERVAAAFATGERAVDPLRVAALLREGLAAASSEIRFVGGVWVTSAQAARRGLEVRFRAQGGLQCERYDQVVNALWAGRLPIDASAGIPTRRPWIFRYRGGFRLRRGPGSPAVPSVTFVVGPYGDAINFADDELYLSWYPACLVDVVRGLAPPEDWQPPPLCPTSFEATLRGLGTLCRAVGRLTAADVLTATRLDGWIMAPGAQDIDDPQSALHRRDNCAVRSRGPYHSVDTAKYTMAPYLAVRAADRMLSETRSRRFVAMPAALAVETSSSL